jgi:type I restriction enzyme S subunit
MLARAGWTRVAFGDVVRQVKDRVDPEESGLERYIAGEHMDTDDLRIRRWGTIGDGYLGPAFHMRFKPGHVLYGSRRTYLRKVAVADFGGITANTTFVLESKAPRALLPEFLPFVMQTETFHEHAIKQSKGSVNPYINFSDLTWFEFPLPPLAEQRRIVDSLAEIGGARESMLRLIAAAEIAEQAAFDHRLDQPDAVPVELGPLLLETRNGCSAVETSSPTGHWVLALSALAKTGYRPGELKPVVRSDAMAAAILRPGDLLISRSNTRELVGLAGTFSEDRADVSWPDTMMRLRPNPAKLRSVFLERLLRSSEGRKQIQSFAAGTSASMKKINATHVQKLRFRIPPIREQDEIVQLSETFGRTRQQIVARLTHLSALNANVLRRALSNDLAS